MSDRSRLLGRRTTRDSRVGVAGDRSGYVHVCKFAAKNSFRNSLGDYQPPLPNALARSIVCFPIPLDFRCPPLCFLFFVCCSLSLHHLHAMCPIDICSVVVRITPVQYIMNA